MGLDERPGNPLQHMGMGHGGLSSQWRYSHNYTHHVYTNMLGMDDDMGFGIMRITRDEPWKPDYLVQPLRNLLLAAIFEWGIALHGLHSAHGSRFGRLGRSAGSQGADGQDRTASDEGLSLFPALSGRRWRRTLTANAAANAIRNLWAYVVIFCGHFPDGAEKFEPVVLKNESEGRMVSTADARHRELRRRPRSGVSQRPPVLPDRAPSVPRPTQQSPPKSPMRCGPSATSTTCPIPPVRCPVSIC